MHEIEIAEVDSFILADKTLDGLMPAWRKTYAADWQIRWGILDELGILRAELCLSVDAKLEKPTIVPLFKRRLIYRFDLVSIGECKPNPPDAWQHGLPPSVCGPHTHPWSVNREHVKNNGFRDLPYRSPVSVAAKTLEHALGTAAKDLNLSVTSDQRDVKPPSQAAFLLGRSA